MKSLSNISCPSPVVNASIDLPHGDTFSKITDTIFSVLVSFSFVQYAWLIAPPQVSFRLAMLLFAYLAAVSSRVGFHKSITPMAYKGSKRFVVDLWILYSYFLLITSAEPLQTGHEHMFRLLAALVFVGIGYVTWDVLKRREYPKMVPAVRIVLSMVFLITSIEILGFYWFDSSLQVVSLFGYSVRNLVFLSLCSGNLIFYWALKYIAPVDEKDLLSRKRNRAVERVLQRFHNVAATS